MKYFRQNTTLSILLEIVASKFNYCWIIFFHFMLCCCQHAHPTKWFVCLFYHRIDSKPEKKIAMCLERFQIECVCMGCCLRFVYLSIHLWLEIWAIAIRCCWHRVTSNKMPNNNCGNFHIRFIGYNNPLLFSIYCANRIINLNTMRHKYIIIFLLLIIIWRPIYRTFAGRDSKE